MGRTFRSVRMGSQEVADRWMKATRALRKEDQIYGQRLAEMARVHSSEGFCALDDPLEAAAFSVLIELLKALDPEGDGPPGGLTGGKSVDKRVDKSVDDGGVKKPDVDL